MASKPKAEAKAKPAPKPRATRAAPVVQPTVLSDDHPLSAPPREGDAPEHNFTPGT